MKVFRKKIKSKSSKVKLQNNQDFLSLVQIDNLRKLKNRINKISLTDKKELREIITKWNLH